MIKKCEYLRGFNNRLQVKDGVIDNSTRKGPFMLIKNIFTILLVVFPILFLYATPIPSISVADVLLLSLYPFLIQSLLSKNKLSVNRGNLLLTLFFIYVVLQSSFSWLMNDITYIDETFLRTLRFSMYLFTVIFIVPNFFNIKLGIKMFRYVSLISTLFLFIQLIIIEIVGVYVPGTIPGLPLMREGLIDFNQNIMDYGYSLVRPRSFFGEPAHYAGYVVIYLAMGLFSKKNKSKEFIPEILITIGLLISNSALGIITGAVIWFIWGLNKLISKYSIRKKIKFIFLAAILCPIVIIQLISTSYFQTFMYRVFGSGNEGLGSAATGRLGNYTDAFSMDGLSLFEILFGRGMVDLEYFIPGIPKLFYYYGLIGMLLFLVILLMIFLFVRVKQKVVVVLILILAIGSDPIFGPNCLLYLIFLVNNKNEWISLDSGR